jgi:hypothetical protein
MRKYFGWTLGAWATSPDSIDDVVDRMSALVGKQTFKKQGHFVLQFFPALPDGVEVHFSHHSGSVTTPEGYDSEYVEIHRGTNAKRKRG